MGIVRLLLAIGLGVLIWYVAMYFIRILSTPPPEVDPEDVIEADQDYRCSVCGAELTLKYVNAAEFSAPRHCREDMVPVWRS
ncbi:MAG TPA: hypothetical protein VJQ57_06515 [Acidimicrobiia bacterium]|nr:hypothetical protein [Acidimicrobiia bacterium]